MTRYRYRPATVEAMRFEGTPASAEAVILWLRMLAPELTVRERTEYAGWEDEVGHIELEIRDHDDQWTTGDWLVLDPGSPPRVRVLDDQAFERLFELDQPATRR